MDLLRNTLNQVGFIPDQAFSDKLKEEGSVFNSSEIRLNVDMKFTFLKRKLVTKGLLIITNKRIVAVLYHHGQYYVIVNTFTDHEYFSLLEIDKSKQNHFIIQIDYDKFPGDLKGKIKLEYQIDPATVPIGE